MAANRAQKDAEDIVTFKTQGPMLMRSDKRPGKHRFCVACGHWSWSDGVHVGSQHLILKLAVAGRNCPGSRQFREGFAASLFFRKSFVAA